MDFSAKNVSVGDHVMYAVPKPPQATTYAHGVVKSIKTSGTVKIDGTNESFEATKDKPVATIEVWAVDEDGNPKSKTDRVVAKPVSELRVSDKPIDPESAANLTLKNKVSEYNKTAPEGRKVTLETLTKVYNRGIGAYKTNPSSVRPNVTSPEQWGYGRVNAFLKMLKSGKAPRKPFDQDLLPKEHPLSSKANDMSYNKIVQNISNNILEEFAAKFDIAEDTMITEGDYVSFMMENDSMFHEDLPPGGMHEHVGSVEHVMYDGYFGVQGSKFYAPASVENPAVLIRIWIDDEETEFMTGSMLS